VLLGSAPVGLVTSGALNVGYNFEVGGDLGISAGSVTVRPAGATPASLSAAGNLTVTTGSLTLRGSDSQANASAKMNAGGSLFVSAGSVLLQGGAADGAFASIDPFNVTILGAGDVILRGGAGANAYALISSTSGNIGVQAGGLVVLEAGSGLNANAGIVAENGSVLINALECQGCGVLFANPVSGSQLVASGVYGSNGVTIQVVQGVPAVLEQTLNNAIDALLNQGQEEGADALLEAMVDELGPESEDRREQRRRRAPSCN